MSHIGVFDESGILVFDDITQIIDVVFDDSNHVTDIEVFFENNRMTDVCVFDESNSMTEIGVSDYYHRCV
jgi:hypothetical protein